ncbi:MAG: hypothetical protein CM15mP49_03820 [Actinomycetota bacterium]|nr:MAG: hypothetical protein CM15mP49_03820 [Actinomycetota bacterium]
MKSHLQKMIGIGICIELLCLPWSAPLLYVVLVCTRSGPPFRSYYCRWQPKSCEEDGFRSATTLQDAFEIASDSVGFSPTITHYHSPPILMADVT